MQDIYLDSIKIHNCRSHPDMEMDFPDGLTVFLGKNGAGKSTVLNAISFALYDYSGDGLTISDMVNRKTKKDLEIILKFRIVENSVTDNYQVELYYEHSKYRNKFTLLKNGIDISGTNKSATYKILEALLIPCDVYHNVYYFRQQVRNFFTSLTNTEQKQIFDAILSTQEYAVYYRNTSETIKVVEDLVTELDRQISIISTSIQIKKNQTLSNLMQSKDKAIKDNELKLFNLTEQKINFENTIQVLETQLEENKFDSSYLDRLRAEIITEREKLSQLSKKLNEKLELVKQDNDNVLSVIKSGFENKKLVKFSDIDEGITNRRKTINDELQKIYQTINDISKKYDTAPLTEELHKFWNDKQKDIKFVDNEYSQLGSQFSTSSLEIERDERIKIIERNIQELKDSANKLKEEASVFKSQIESKESLIKEDLDSLNQEVPICSKCLRPFSGSDGGSVIRASADKNQSDVDNLKKSLSELASKMEPLKIEYTHVLTLKSTTELDYSNRIKIIKDKKLEQEQILIRKKNLINDEITSFRSEIENKKNLLISKKNIECLEWETKKSNLEQDLSELTQKAKNDKTAVERIISIDMDSKIDEQNKKYSELCTQIKEKSNSEITTISINIHDIESGILLHSKEQTHFDSTKQELSKLKLLLNNANDLIIESKNFKFDDSHIVKVADEIIKHEKDMLELTQKKSQYVKEISVLEFWKEAYSDTGIKSMLIDMALPFLNESVAKALDVVAPGVFTVSFDTLKANKAGDIKDKFNVNILHNIKGTDSHKMLSGGEKRLVDLCCMEALRSLSEKLYNKRFHHIFYDEVLDSLDDDNCEAFSQASKLLSVNKNITLITHKITEKIEPDRTFKF